MNSCSLLEAVSGQWSAGVSIRNIPDYANPGLIVSNIASPPFGQASQMYGQINGEGFPRMSATEIELRFVLPSDSRTTTHCRLIVTTFVFGSVVWPSTVKTRSVSPLP